MLTTKLRNINAKILPKKQFFGPEWLILGVNNVCNLHCKMCDVGTQFEGSNFYVNLVGTRPLNMPEELIFNVIDQAAHYYPNVKLGYAFTEPLVYKHLIESLEYADSKNLFTSITTNALTLKKDAGALCKAGLNELFVSLDGPADVHNEIRGHKSSFEKAIAGIEAVLEHNKRPDISIFCVVTEWNIGRLKEFADYFKKVPLKQLGYMHTNYTPDEVADVHNKTYGKEYPATASNMEEIDISKMDLDVLFEEIEQIRKSDYDFPVTFSPEIKERRKLEEFYLHPEKIIGRMCNDVFRNIMIKSDGSVIPAHGRCYNLTIGNLYDQNLKEIWHSAKLADFRKTLMDAGGLLPACSRCCSAF